MNDRPRQDPAQAFVRIITMMLQAVRARGWRGLKELPKIWLATMVVRGYGQAFAALVADFRAGKLLPDAPAREPAPEPWTEAPEREAMCAQPAASPRPAARTDTAARGRRRLAVRRAVAAGAVEPDRPRVKRLPMMRVWAHAVPCVRALFPLPESLAGVAAGIAKKIAWKQMEFRAEFITLPERTDRKT